MKRKIGWFHYVAWLIGTIAIAGQVSAAEVTDGSPQTELPRITIGAGMYQIDSQVAATAEQREIGLMYRKTMPQQEGMLFVFPEPGVQCFWMKNTLVPLTAAFVDDDGRIVNLADMRPLTTQSHCSDKPVRFVLEMNQGWFAKKKIEAGFRLTGVSFRRM